MQATGNREQGIGNRQQGTGNREQATGNRQQRVCGVWIFAAIEVDFGS
jgi:hypothetical protein